MKSYIRLVIIVNILWLVAFTDSAQAQATPATSDSNVIEKEVSVGSDTVAIHCIGEGNPTVVMADGRSDFGGRGGFSYVRPKVAAFTRVCVYEVIGERQEIVTAKSVARNWRTVLRAAKVEGPYVIVGASWSGYPARMFAYDYPDEVVGMVLIDSSHEEEGSRVLATLSAASADENPGVQELRAIYEPAIADGVNYVESDEQVRAARQARGNSPLLGALPLIVLTPTLGSNSNDWPASLPEDLASRLEVTWMELQEDAATLSSNSKLIVVENSGHDIEVDQPEVVVEAIQQVVEAVRTGAPLE
jgi:pimeloyl-ACP methyl ester carboxylesterase